MHRVIAALSVLISLGSSVPVDKWQRSSDGCPYYIETQQNFNWSQAWEECLNKNATLLDIDSLYKKEQIDGLMKENIGKNIPVWLAGHENAVEKRYVWTSTGKTFSYTNWAPGNPNNQPNEHCIFIRDSTNQWHDFPCATKLGFICEDLECIRDNYPEFQVNSGKDTKIFEVTTVNAHG